MGLKKLAPPATGCRGVHLDSALLDDSDRTSLKIAYCPPPDNSPLPDCRRLLWTAPRQKGSKK